MKKLVLFSLLLLSILSCKKEDNIYLKNNELEIYTNSNIYYVNLEKLEVSDEVSNKIYKFEDFRSLSKYISDITAENANSCSVDLPEEYKAMSLRTPIEGYYSPDDKKVYIFFK